jgi:hypothetical protein
LTHSFWLLPGYLLSFCSLVCGFHPFGDQEQVGQYKDMCSLVDNLLAGRVGRKVYRDIVRGSEIALER